MSRRGEKALAEVWDDKIRIGDLPHLRYHSPDPPPALYQAVKRELVAKIPRCGGQITEAEVNDVIDGPGVQ